MFVVAVCCVCLMWLGVLFFELVWFALSRCMCCGFSCGVSYSIVLLFVVCCVDGVASLRVLCCDISCRSFRFVYVLLFVVFACCFDVISVGVVVWCGLVWRIVSCCCAWFVLCLFRLCVFVLLGLLRIVLCCGCVCVCVCLCVFGVLLWLVRFVL